MKPKRHPLLGSSLRALALALSITGICTAQSTPPDLTQPGAIAAIKAKEDIPKYDNTYNLGSTGLRGWVHQDWSGTWIGQMTDASRQILVTTATTPGSVVMAVDDVILGAIAASSGTVPAFTSDARKAFGTAITNAEKTGAGTLRVKRWRAGTSNDVNIPIATLGTYSATAPYSCPKSTLILANARDQMVGKLLADPNYLDGGHAGAINALALLASVVPGHPNYSAVQTRLQTYARSLTTPLPSAGTWGAAYQLIFLSEYYLLTSDSQVVPVINGSTVRFAKGQGMFGTFGHGMGVPHPDGSGRMIIPWYGPVNVAGNAANIAIVLGKKALVAASHPIDPEIDAAIHRASGFMGSHVNKGAMQYGEHFPHAGSHSTNSREPQAAVFFGLQNDKAVQTEYFARTAISSWIGVENGHSGQGWGTLWGALGAGMGGEAAAAGHFKQLLWRYDIQRRTDGSFTYDSDTGGNDYYGGKTADGTYLGESLDSDVKASSLYLLTYSLPLKRLHITGKDLNSAYNHDLDATKIANAVSAASFFLDRAGLSTAQLFADLGEYDPHVRHFASLELASRHMQNSVLTSTDLANLRDLLNDPNPNLRQSAAQVLGYLQDSTALPILVALLRDPDHWVRQKAANAIRYYANTAAVSVHRNAMLEAFIANGPADPDAIDWSDPLEFSNGQLGQLLFGSTDNDGAIFPRYSIAASTANAPKVTHLYPALRIGLQIPSGRSRSAAANFLNDYLSPVDAQAIFPELAQAQSYIAPGDTMFGQGPRDEAMKFLAASKIKEGIPLALAVLEEGGGNEALAALASYGDAARYTLPTLRRFTNEWAIYDGNGTLRSDYVNLLNTITSIENAITAPATLPGLCIANAQIVATTAGAKAITLTGSSHRGMFSFLNVTQPANGTLTGSAPHLTYTPNAGYSGIDQFTFRTKDSMTTSDPATVSIIVGSAAGTGIVGAYFNNADFTSPVLSRNDSRINFDWGTGSPDPSIGADTFSARWDGLLRVPETGAYTFSTLNSDGARLHINGQMVIDDFADQTTNWTDSIPVNLTAGQLVDLQMFYYENTGSAVAKLKWTGPSIAGANGDIIGSQWLYDGTGTTLTPYAHSQSVTMLKDTTIPITLTGSGGTLTYQLTGPAPEGLSGTAPNMTYTPPAGFSGAVSFTFRVNNGTSDSVPATVSINVQEGTLTSFTWASAVSGNWNDGTKWTPSLPAAGGMPFYALNFTTSGSYTATQNLNNGFQLNQLSTAANVTLDGTNSLSFVANGGTLPQFNQNGPDPVTVTHPISLQATTTMGGSGLGTVSLTGTISGNGGIIKNNHGELSIDQNNTYSGGTVINGGTVQMEWQRSTALGTGPITLNGATLKASRPDASNPIIANSGTLDFASGWGNIWNGPITLNGDLKLITPYFDNITLNGVVSGAGGLIVEAPWWSDGPYSDWNGVYLTATNTYTGKTIVRKGMTLICTKATALGSGALEIRNLARVNLNFSGNKNIASLTLDGIVMPPGIYGSTASPAANKNNTYFFGTGTVTVSNNAPVAVAQSVSTAEDTAMPITLTGTDAENSPLTYQIVSQPTQGTLSGTAPNLTYTPAIDFYGADSFNFRVKDGTMDSAVATVSITVTPVNNDPPAFISDPITLTFAFENIAYTGQTLAGWANDPDEGSSLTYSIVSGPAWLAVAPDGTLSGTPGSGTAGLNSFVVRATDNTSATAEATLQITVLPYVLTGSGSISREVWTGIAGTPVSAIPVGSAPNISDTLSSFEGPSNWADNYGTRIRGYLTAPATGSYTFWIASDDNSQLWLSTDIQPANKVKIAEVTSWASSRQWNKFASQKSVAVHLMAGLRYYVEVLQKEGGGGDNVAVGWAKPGESTASPSEVIPGGQLTPFDPDLPTIATFNPADNAIGVTVGANLVATFSENIARGTTGNITLKNLSDATQTTFAITDTAQISISSATLTISPTVDLLPGKNYAVRIEATAIDDTAGNSFAGILDDTIWNFVTAAPIATTTTVVTSGSPTIYGDSVTFTATVVPIPSGGSVQFFDGGIELGDPVAVNGSGEATYSTTTLGASTHEITAVYSGNLPFTGSTSQETSQVVNKAQLTVTASNVARAPNTANPDPLPFEITGFKNGENLGTSGVTGTPALSTTAVPASPGGTYPITCAVGTLAADNYDFTTAPGVLSVVPVSPPMAYEGFDYAAGGLAGGNGGSGFSGAWAAERTNGTGYVVSSDGLAFSNLSATGGRVQVQANGGFAASSRIGRDLSVSNSGQTYGSFLYRLESPLDTNRWEVASLMFGAANEADNDHTATVNPSEWQLNVGTRAEGNVGSAVGARLTQGETFLVLFSAQLNNGSQTVTMWVLNAGQFDNFKTGSLTEAELSGASVGSGITDVWAKSIVSGTASPLGAVDRLKFMAFGGGDGIDVSFDELRLSQTSLDSVTPLQEQSTFATWAAANAGGQTAGEDYDNDGVENGIEYFMGETGSSFTATPGLDANNMISWPADADYQGTYEVQTSPDLATWTNVDPRPVPSGGTLSYTLPPGAPGGKSFVRLLVTPTP